MGPTTAQTHKLYSTADLCRQQQCGWWVQDNAIATLVKVMREAHAEERKTLFVVGSYHIGKERAFFGAARALGFKIWCHAAKKQVALYL